MSYKFNPFTGQLDLVGAGTPAVVSSSDKLAVSLKNNSGVTINLMSPVIINSSGEIEPIDVSNITEKRIIGIANENIPNGSFGLVIVSGQIKDVTVTPGIGSVVYVSKSGGLTASIPSVGSNGFLEGDALIKLGTISINEDNPINKDFIIGAEIIVIL